MSSKETSVSRRTCLIRLASAAAVIPLASLATTAAAAKNDGLRKSLAYQDSPKDGKQCGGCTQFVPGKSADGPGGCKIIPGDDEISPKGFCNAFVAKK